MAQSTQINDSFNSGSQLVLEKQLSRNSTNQSINANISSQSKGTLSGTTKRPSQDFQNTQFIQANKQANLNIKPQASIPINQSKVVSLTPILEQTPTSDKQRSLSSQNADKFSQKSPSINSQIPTDLSLTPNSSRMQKNNSMYQQIGNNNFPFSLTITTTTSPQPAMTPQIIIPQQQTNNPYQIINPSQITTPQPVNPPSLSISTSQKLGSAQKNTPQYTTSPPKTNSPPKPGSLKKVPSVPKYGHHMPVKKDSDQKTPKNYKPKSPINKSQNSVQYQQNSAGKQKVNKKNTFEMSGIPSNDKLQTPKNSNEYYSNQDSESSIQMSQRLNQQQKANQVNVFSIDPAFTPQPQVQQPKPSIQPELIDNQSQNKFMTFGASSQPFGISASFGVAAQDQPEKIFSIQPDQMKNQDVSNKYFNLNSEQNSDQIKQEFSSQQLVSQQQKEMFGHQIDQNFNKEELGEQVKNNQTKQNKQLYQMLQPSIPYTQTNYQQGGTNKIQFQDIKTQNNQFTNEKMFTFESPHKVNQNDPQNKFFPSDGKVNFDGKSQGLETPPKRSTNTYNQQNSPYNPEDQINKINQQINFIQSDKKSLNSYNSSDKKVNDQYSQSEKKYPDPLNSQSYKYQSPFEKNLYGQNLNQGGVSSTVPQNKFEIQNNNNFIGQNHSYNEGIMKQICQPFTQQKDQNESNKNIYQYQSNVQDSLREFQNSTTKFQDPTFKDLKTIDNNVSIKLLSNTNQSIPNSAQTSNANIYFGQEQFIKENKPMFQSFSEQNQFKGYDPVKKDYSISFNEQPQKTEEVDILSQITDKLSKLHSPREEQPKQTSYNQYAPSYNLVNSMKYEEAEINSQRDPLPLNNSNSQNQINEINFSQIPSLKTHSTSIHNNFTSSPATNNLEFSNPTNNFGTSFSSNNIGTSSSSNTYGVSPNSLNQGSKFLTNNYTSINPANNNYASSFSGNYMKDTPNKTNVGDNSSNSYRLSSNSNHVGPDTTYFRQGQTNNNYGNISASSYLDNKMEISAPIENKYYYQTELDGSSNTYAPQRFSQPSYNQEVNKQQGLKNQQYGSTEALNNYQNNTVLTDWKSLNEKIDDKNKKFQLEFEVNSKINAKKPFQFTSVQSPFEYTSNQQSSSFSYDPLRQNQTDTFDKQKPSYSFVQPPNITTDPQNQLSDFNSHKTQSPENTSEKFILPPLNSEIQSILDRYIPKSTPALQTDRSFNFNQSLTPTGYNSNPIQIPPKDDFLEKIKKNQNQQVYKENQLDCSLDKSKEIYQETNQNNNLQAYSVNNTQFDQNNNQDFKQKPNQGSNKKYSLLNENEAFKIILNGGNNLGFNNRNANTQNEQQNQNLYQSNDFGNENFKINTLDSQRSLVSSTNLQNYDEAQQETQKNEIYISDSYTTLTVPNNQNSDTKKKEYSISVHESQPSNNNKDNLYLNGSFCELPSEKPKRATKISVASILSSRQLKKEKLNVFSSNTLSANLAFSCDDLSYNEKSGVLSQKILLSFPRLKHQLSKYTCEQVLEQIFDSFSLSLQYLTKDYFVFRMQTLVKQFVPNILSMELITKEISALFEAADLNQNWQLDINELGAVFSQLCRPSDDSPIKLLFKEIDKQNTGQITLTEFQNFAQAKGYDQVAFTKQLDSIKKNHITYYDFLLQQKIILFLFFLSIILSIKHQLKSKFKNLQKDQFQR